MVVRVVEIVAARPAMKWAAVERVEWQVISRVRLHCLPLPESSKCQQHCKVRLEYQRRDHPREHIQHKVDSTEELRSPDRGGSELVMLLVDLPRAKHFY